jgi:hypothetical protein
MVCMSTVYRFTVFIYFNLEFSGEENQGQGQGRHEENVRSEIQFSEVLLLLHFWDINFLASLRFLQYHRSRFYATCNSSCSRQNIQIHPIEGIPRYKLNRNSTEVSQG